MIFQPKMKMIVQDHCKQLQSKEAVLIRWFTPTVSPHNADFTPTYTPAYSCCLFIVIPQRTIFSHSLGRNRYNPPLAEGFGHGQTYHFSPWFAASYNRDLSSFSTGKDLEGPFPMKNIHNQT